MTLTYWVAECLNGGGDNVRARTRKQVVKWVAEYNDPGSYGPVKRVSIEYRDGLDLAFQCFGGPWWEATG